MLSCDCPPLHQGHQDFVWSDWQIVNTYSNCIEDGIGCCANGWNDGGFTNADHIFFLMFLLPPRSTLFPYTTLFRSRPSRHLASGGFLHRAHFVVFAVPQVRRPRSEEHTSELQSPCKIVCRLLLE